MAPHHLEVAHAVVVRGSFVAGHGVQEGDVERAAELIAFHIVEVSRESPAPLGVDFAAQGEIEIVVDGEVVTSVAKIESAVEIVAESGEYYSARVFFGKREIAEGEGEGEWNVGEHHVSRSGHDILFGSYLGFGQLEIEMWMFMVFAGGVFAVFYVEGSVLGALGLSSGEVSVLLLGDYFGDAGS